LREVRSLWRCLGPPAITCHGASWHGCCSPACLPGKFKAPLFSELGVSRRRARRRGQLEGGQTWLVPCKRKGSSTRHGIGSCKWLQFAGGIATESLSAVVEVAGAIEAVWTRRGRREMPLGGAPGPSGRHR